MKFTVKILSIILVLGFGYSCSKEEAQTTKINSILTTTEITNISTTTAQSGGNITSEGNSAITARGVCWSTFANPTIDNNKTSDSSGIGMFTSLITGLTPNTKYYVRAYSVNSLGASYGNQVEFTTDNIPPTAPCNPTKNSVIFNGKKDTYYSTGTKNIDETTGKYEVIANALKSSMLLSFGEEPKNGKYLIDGDREPKANECFVEGVFGDLFTYSYTGKSGDTIYVKKTAPGKYIITFCNVYFTSASNDFKFYSDGNITVE